MNDTVPSRHHTWAEPLRLVGAVRHIAYDHTLDPGDVLRRIRATIADLQGRSDDAARERRKQFRVIDGGQT